MKSNFKITKAFRLIIVFTLFTVSLSIAQDCTDVSFMKKGAILEYTDYNKRGKPESTTVHETIEVSEDGSLVNAIIKATVVNTKDKKTFDTQYNVGCNNGLFSVDMIRFFDFNKLSEYNEKENLKFKIDGDVLEFPNGMKTGDHLDDGNITIKLNSNGFTLVTMAFNVFNRKIVGEEQITTPAGTFMCQKVTFDFDSKFGIINVKGSGVEWYYNNAMVVKSESYNKRGKLIGYHEITKVQ